MDYGVYAAIATSIGTFVAGVLGAWAAFRTSSHNRENAFRDDLLKMNNDLRGEIGQLKGRLDTLEKELDDVWSENRQYQVIFTKACVWLMKEHGIDLEAWLREQDK